VYTASVVKRRRPVVHSEKVGLLDGHHRRGKQKGAQQPHPPIVKAAADEKGEGDGEQINQSGQKTTQQVNSVVGGEIDRAQTRRAGGRA
jgi:hypothetical protein